MTDLFEALRDLRAHLLSALCRGGMPVTPMDERAAAKDEPSVSAQDRMEGCD